MRLDADCDAAFSSKKLPQFSDPPPLLRVSRFETFAILRLSPVHDEETRVTSPPKRRENAQRKKTKIRWRFFVFFDPRPSSEERMKNFVFSKRNHSFVLGPPFSRVGSKTRATTIPPKKGPGQRWQFRERRKEKRERNSLQIEKKRRFKSLTA